jgi:hypothetical protein
MMPDESEISPTSSVLLTWAAPISSGATEITDYVVEYKKSDDSSWIVAADGVTGVDEATGLNALIPGLSVGLTYDFRIAAKNALGWRLYTEAKSIVIPKVAFIKNTILGGDPGFEYLNVGAWAQSTTGYAVVHWWDGKREICGTGDASKRFGMTRSVAEVGSQVYHVYASDSAGIPSGDLIYLDAVGRINVISISRLPLLAGLNGFNFYQLSSLNLSGLINLSKIDLVYSDFSMGFNVSDFLKQLPDRAGKSQGLISFSGDIFNSFDTDQLSILANKNWQITSELIFK